MPADHTTAALSYLQAVAAQDWARCAQLLDPQVVRRGPFSDEYRGRLSYLEFLQRLMPALVDYSMQIATTIADGATVVVRLSETMSDGSKPITTAEVLVFTFNGGGLIEELDIYIQHPAS